METDDIRILLDSGVSLGQRFGIAPHPLEYKALKEAREKISEFASKAEVISISHYHFDHYTAPWKRLEAKWTWSNYNESEKIYRGKTVYAKDYRSRINYSQRKRGYIFSKIASNFIKEIIFADSKTYQKGETLLKFSEPIYHGEEKSELGYVIAVEISCGSEKLSFYPDVQGPMSEHCMNQIIKGFPNILIIGGPPLYLSGWRVKEESVKQALLNLKRIVEQVPLTLLDHHILRNEDGLAKVASLTNYAEKFGNEVRTFAEHLGIDNKLLEARRRQLFEEYPPNREYQRWMNLNSLHQRYQPPPL